MLRLTSQPRTICIFLKKSERRSLNTTSPCANLLLNLTGPYWRQDERNVGCLFGQTEGAGEAAPLRRRIMAGDALDQGIVDAVDRELIVGRQQLERRRLAENEIGVGRIGERRRGCGQRDHDSRDAQKNIRSHVIGSKRCARSMRTPPARAPVEANIGAARPRARASQRGRANAKLVAPPIHVHGAGRGSTSGDNVRIRISSTKKGAALRPDRARG